MAAQAFLCHNSGDSAFVIEVAKHLKRNLEGVFYYEDYQREDQHFAQLVNEELVRCRVMVVFVGGNFSQWQVNESLTALERHNRGETRQFFVIYLKDEKGKRHELPATVAMLSGFPAFEPELADASGAARIASKITTALDLVWISKDDLPLDPHLFSYEKDIIQFFTRLNRYRDTVFQEPSPKEVPGLFEEIRDKLLKGCPATWPSVTQWKGSPGIPNRLDPEDVGKWRPESASVVTAALHDSVREPESRAVERLTFPEAGPRETLYFPRPRGQFKVAILVSGGIAPGINAVIDGIVQRHWLYAKHHGYESRLRMLGLENGFRAFDNIQESHRPLSASETSDHVNEGGSFLGTSRVDELIDANERFERLEEIVDQLRGMNIDILYVIGGDGSMKAAHAIWSVAKAKDSRNAKPLSVVAIPKTMDNDILWMWQSFGFLSAVEKGREVIEHLNTEVQSNPRVCIAQLFGSDSGFVVSHAVLASATGHCTLALIPEIEFSLKKVAQYLKSRIRQQPQRIPFGLVVMSETAIPVDAMDYVSEPGGKPCIDIGLNEEEKEAIRRFQAMREKKERIQGQTNDALRTAGLKIVSRGLLSLLPDPSIGDDPEDQTDWDKLRVFTNEPRHLLRAIPPSSSDIVIGHRLGTLAVDNAMAGYTDFMISQWLTEYVLVPLKLVVLGRKRIPKSGIFWKSVLAKTGQPSDLT